MSRLLFGFAQPWLDPWSWAPRGGDDGGGGGGGGDDKPAQSSAPASSPRPTPRPTPAPTSSDRDDRPSVSVGYGAGQVDPALARAAGITTTSAAAPARTAVTGGRGTVVEQPGERAAAAEADRQRQREEAARRSEEQQRQEDDANRRAQEEADSRRAQEEADSRRAEEQQRLEDEANRRAAQEAAERQRQADLQAAREEAERRAQAAAQAESNRQAQEARAAADRQAREEAARIERERGAAASAAVLSRMADIDPSTTGVYPGSTRSSAPASVDYASLFDLTPEQEADFRAGATAPSAGTSIDVLSPLGRPTVQGSDLTGNLVSSTMRTGQMAGRAIQSGAEAIVPQSTATIGYGQGQVDPALAAAAGYGPNAPIAVGEPNVVSQFGGQMAEGLDRLANRALSNTSPENRAAAVADIYDPETGLNLDALGTQLALSAGPTLAALSGLGIGLRGAMLTGGAMQMGETAQQTLDNIDAAYARASLVRLTRRS
jgi:hypothetical protein